MVFQCEIVQFYIEILGNCLDIKGCLSLFVTLYLAVLILQIILCEILLFLPWQARARHGKGKHVGSFRFITDIQQKASWSTPLRVTAVLDCGVRSFPLRISKYVLVVVPISSIQIHLGSKETKDGFPAIALENAKFVFSLPVCSPRESTSLVVCLTNRGQEA